MTTELKACLALSVGVHAALLVGLPLTSPVAFDVERGPTSVELYLVSPPTPAPSPDPTDLARTATPDEPVHEMPEPQPPPQPTLISEERRGALTEMLPSYLRNPPPLYPARARERGEEGTVLLEVEVLSSGRCGAVNVVRSSGSPELDQAAARAVRRWIFRPARRWYYPVSFWVEIPITFRLLDGPSASVSP